VTLWSPRARKNAGFALSGKTNKARPTERVKKAPFLQALDHFSFSGQTNEKELSTTAIFLLTGNRRFGY